MGLYRPGRGSRATRRTRVPRTMEGITRLRREGAVIRGRIRLRGGLRCSSRPCHWLEGISIEHSLLIAPIGFFIDDSALLPLPASIPIPFAKSSIRTTYPSSSKPTSISLVIHQTGFPYYPLSCIFCSFSFSPLCAVRCKSEVSLRFFTTLFTIVTKYTQTSPLLFLNPPTPTP